MSEAKITIGVLALQGAFIEHIHMLERLGVAAPAVRLPQELACLDGLIIPGGESTTQSKLMCAFGLADGIREMARRGKPLLGTCAGMILLGRTTSYQKVETLALMDLDVRRNAFGRQVDSFETDLEMPALGEPSFHAVFIRAPVIERVGREVLVLARLPSGAPVAVRQGAMIAAAFHPELTEDTRFHRYFLDMVACAR